MEIWVVTEQLPVKPGQLVFPTDRFTAYAFTDLEAAAVFSAANPYRDLHRCELQEPEDDSLNGERAYGSKE